MANPGPTWDVEGTAGSTAITPGSGSFTDDLGNVYTISAAGDVALVNGSPVFEGGGTAKLEYYNNTLYGQDAATVWYRLVSDGSWAASAAPGFFADGSPGIVLQNTDGSVALWDMNGTSIVGGGLVANPPGPGLGNQGQGVFSDDGSTDIVFQNTDGAVALWDMSGINVVGGGLVANPGARLANRGHGRLLRRGNSAILLQNTDGRSRYGI